ncbi:PAS domain-containing sensor histidine kinase [Mucilaginibacter sp.]
MDNNLFRLLIDQVGNYGIFMTDPNGYVMSWNIGANHIKGYKNDEIIGKHISVFYIDADIKKGEALSNLNKTLKKGSHETQGLRIRKDGAVFWANDVFNTIYDDDGKLVGFAVITRDISEQKQNEELNEGKKARLEKRIKDDTLKIFSNDIRFRQLVENSHDGIILFNHNLDVIFRSLSAQNIDGWSDKDIACHEMNDFVHPDDIDKVVALFKDVKEKPGIPVKIIFRTRHKQGHYISIECVFTNWLNNVNINAIVCNFRDISEQLKAQEEISKKTEQIEDILESITDGFIALDNNMCYTYANKSAGNMLDIPPQSLIGKDVFALFPDAIGSSTYNAFKEALDQQHYVCNEYYYAPLDLWQENHIYPSHSGLSVFIRDISLRKRHEELQAQSRAILEEASTMQAAILNALPPNIAVLNKKGKIIAVNNSWKKLTLINNLGLPDYGIGYNYMALCDKAMGIDNADINKIANGINEVINGSQSLYTLEYPWNANGGKRWYQLMVAPLLDSKHKGAVVQHINITDRKLAEESLLQSEANLRSIFENTDFSIVLFDIKLKIVSFNTNAQNLAAVNGKKLKKGNSAFSYFEKSRKPFMKMVEKKVKNKEIVNYETTYQPKNGTIEWFDASWMGVVNQAGDTIGYILTLKDITAKKLADIEREKISADLVKRNTDLEHFTYIISHNLRAPLANIIGLSELLHEADFQTEGDKKTLEALSHSVNNLDSVIIDLNHILQATGNANEEFSEVNLKTLIDEICISIDHLVKKEGVSVKLDFEISSIFTIKTYLYSILYNLIINSIKYRRPNISPVIKISSFQQDDKLITLFKDNGRGIDLPKHANQLFGLYKRFDLSVEGKGMGLFMVKRQIEKLSGTISVKSEPGAGTEFKLEFPLLR